MNTGIYSTSRFAVAGATLAVLLMAASADAQTRRVEKHFAVQGNPVVTVRNSSGHIQVKAWDKHEVMIVAVSDGSGAEVDTEQSGNRIEAVTRIVGDHPTSNDVKTDYEVTVPTESELQIRTDSGAVTVESVHGDMSFDTVAADLYLGHLVAGGAQPLGDRGSRGQRDLVLGGPAPGEYRHPLRAHVLI